MNAPAMVPATLRGKAAVAEVRELLAQLDEVYTDIERHDQDKSPENARTTTDEGVAMTYGEVREVLVRRRDAILLKLENKGIKVAPDPMPVTAGESA
jgi:uncharacterized protein with LGFP repeats